MSAPKVADAGAAAQQLESYFLRRVLSEVKTSGGDSGFAGDTFKEMFDGAIADAMTAGGGVGLAASIQHQLEQSPAPLAKPATPIGRPSAYGKNATPAQATESAVEKSASSSAHPGRTTDWR